GTRRPRPRQLRTNHGHRTLLSRGVHQPQSAGDRPPVTAGARRPGGDTDAGDAFGARLPLPLGAGAAVLRGPAAGRGGHRDAHIPGREPRTVPDRSAAPSPAALRGHPRLVGSSSHLCRRRRLGRSRLSPCTPSAPPRRSPRRITADRPIRASTWPRQGGADIVLWAAVAVLPKTPRITILQTLACPRRRPLENHATS